MTSAADGEAAAIPLPDAPRLARALGPLTGADTAAAGASPGSDPSEGWVAAGREPVVATGRSAFVVGGGSPSGTRAKEGAGPGLEVWVHPFRLARDLGLAGARAVATRAGPAGIERRLRARDHGIVERIVVPPRGRHAVLEWEAEGREDGGAAELTLMWRVDLRTAPAPGRGEGDDHGVGPLEWTVGDRALLVRSDAGRLGFFAFSVPPLSLTARASDTGAAVVGARLSLPPGETVRLALIGGAGAALRRDVRAVERTPALVRGLAGEADRLRRERLSLDAPDPDRGRALERAELRLLAHAAASPVAGTSLLAAYEPLAGSPWPTEFRTRDSVHGALAGLAMGEGAIAAEVLRFLARHGDGEGRIPVAVSLGGEAAFGEGREADDAALLFLLLAARHLGWTGDVPTARSVWETVRAVLGTVPSPGGALAGALVPAAEAVGDAGTAARLRTAASPGRPAPDRAGREARRGPGREAAAAGGGEPEAALLGDPPLPGGVRAAARTILAVSGGLLGAEADATAGRLVLRPRPPEPWDRFVVRSLVVGSASVSVSYGREAGTHRFDVAQDRGGAPLQLVLEPELPGRLRAARVDGLAADLEPVQADDRLRVPVQLVLDHPRTVELEMTELPERR